MLSPYRTRTVCEGCGSVTVHEARPESFGNPGRDMYWPARYVCYECGRPLYADEAVRRGLPDLDPNGEPQHRKELSHARHHHRT